MSPRWGSVCRFSLFFAELSPLWGFVLPFVFVVCRNIAPLGLSMVVSLCVFAELSLLWGSVGRVLFLYRTVASLGICLDLFYFFTEISPSGALFGCFSVLFAELLPLWCSVCRLSLLFAEMSPDWGFCSGYYAF